MNKDKIAIIGLGYVGLPLARLFATKYSVVGFDINTERITELISGVDSTLEVDNETLQSVLVSDSSDSNGLFCTNQLAKIKDCNYYIITVPTPVDKNNRPILTPLIKASETVGAVLKKGDIVNLNVFFDSETFPFKLKFLGHESIKTTFGKIKCIKFRPYVMAGRVFKDEESLTLWVTADANKVPAVAPYKVTFPMITFSWLGWLNEFLG